MEKVSVILPVFNSELYISDAIKSILDQTYSNLELIIVDDLSTDSSLKIIQEFNDKRIIIIQNEKNLGRAGCDNVGIKHASGAFIAKMDSDDIAHPDRLKLQIDYLTANKNINAVGSFMQNFGDSNYMNVYPLNYKASKCTLLFCLPVGNPSVVFRRSIFDEGACYDVKLRQTEDYDFFARYSDLIKVDTIPLPLIRYRTYPENYKKTILSDRLLAAMQVREAFLNKIGINFSKEEIRIHHCLSHYELPADNIDSAIMVQWLDKLVNFNKTTKYFDHSELTKLLQKKWFEYWYLHSHPAFKSIINYNKKVFNQDYKIPAGKKVKFLIKGIKNFWNNGK